MDRLDGFRDHERTAWAGGTRGRAGFQCFRARAGPIQDSEVCLREALLEPSRHNQGVQRCRGSSGAGSRLPSGRRQHRASAGGPASQAPEEVLRNRRCGAHPSDTDLLDGVQAGVRGYEGAGRPRRGGRRGAERKRGFGQRDRRVRSCNGPRERDGSRAGRSHARRAVKKEATLDGVCGGSRGDPRGGRSGGHAPFACDGERDTHAVDGARACDGE